MRNTKGRCSKRRKKMVDETHDAQKHVRVTRSKAANNRISSVNPINNDATTVQNQDQLERAQALAVKHRRQTPDAALKPVSIAAAADITKGTKGVASNPPKLTAPIRCIQKNGASSPNRDNQPKDECVDENIDNGNQGSCPSSESSRNSKPSNVKSFMPPQKNEIDELIEFERDILRLSGEDDDGLQPRMLTLPSSSTQYVENVLPSTTVEKTGLLKTHSFNLTAMMEDHCSSSDDDDEQAESSIDPALTNVEGYHVKTEVAPMLERIFKKYHDIARECIIKNPKMVVLVLETVCSFCQKLENTGLKDIMESELEDMTLFVEKYQQMGFDVQWLIERLKDVSEMKCIMKDYPTLRDGKLKTEMKEKEVDMLKQKLSVAKAELATMKAAEDGERYRIFYQQINAFKVKGLSSWGTSVLYGLF